MEIAIIGCGSMGSALAEKLSVNKTLFFFDKNPKKAEELAQNLKGEACFSLTDVFNKAKMVFLAIKPQQLKQSSHEIASLIKPGHIIISILSGVQLEKLEKLFPNALIVRMMPNISVKYGTGVMGFVKSQKIDLKLRDFINETFAPLGMVYWLEEKQMDALTALTGSGPAFILTFIESITEAGISMGFSADEALKLILKMIEGTCSLLQQSQEHPAQLKWKITSPGGTTIAGIKALEKENVRNGIIETFLACYERSKEMSKD